MQLDPESLNARDMYQWMTHSVLPRPIAWVSTINGDGVSNLAPFSFFNAVCARPPTLMFCPANDRFGRKKDTLVNIEANGEFVLHLVSFALAESMNATAASLPHGESEFERFNIPAVPSTVVRPPRIPTAPIAFECKLDRIVRISEGPIGGNAVFGRIVQIHAQDAVLGAEGRPDPALVDLVSRGGGDFYFRLGERFPMTRPE
jgi:flavin reductase (DIM6/NTAB) family NADH-FMN oxidoreductase RutF